MGLSADLELAELSAPRSSRAAVASVLRLLAQLSHSLDRTAGDTPDAGHVGLMIRGAHPI